MIELTQGQGRQVRIEPGAITALIETPNGTDGKCLIFLIGTSILVNETLDQVEAFIKEDQGLQNDTKL